MNYAADAYQSFFRGDDTLDATAAGGEFARMVAYLIAFVDAHRKGK